MVHDTRLLVGMIVAEIEDEDYASARYQEGEWA